ncbi:uncharacterized protein LOC143212000 isoform X6 [Lasioglossum baleicum]|uniref:uncharacterized protein LOC143212000 isoform X6 n=1 Tax=Lasioglossum baleicum TaxID=434251 RepID=UPI003FCD7D25
MRAVRECFFASGKRRERHAEGIYRWQEEEHRERDSEPRHGTRIAGVDWIQYADTCSHAEGIPRIPRCRELQAGAAARLGSTTFRTRGTRERESGQKNKIRIRTINRED